MAKRYEVEYDREDYLDGKIDDEEVARHFEIGGVISVKRIDDEKIVVAIA